MHTHRTNLTRRGFTLIEAAISTLIVGVMVTAAISVVGTAARGAAREREWRQSATLASALMAEVLAAAFEDPQAAGTWGLETGETIGSRSTFDDLDDFDGFTESPATDADGNKLTWSAGWQRSVEVVNVKPLEPAKVAEDTENTGLRKIEVRVSTPSGQVRSLVALKARQSPADAFPVQLGVDRITGIRIKLRVGRSGSALLGAATLFNAPTTTMASAPLNDAKVVEATVEPSGGK